MFYTILIYYDSPHLPTTFEYYLSSVGQLEYVDQLEYTPEVLSPSAKTVFVTAAAATAPIIAKANQNTMIKFLSVKMMKVIRI